MAVHKGHAAASENALIYFFCFKNLEVGIRTDHDKGKDDPAKLAQETVSPGIFLFRDR